MNGPDGRFAIVPIAPGPAPAESIVIGPMSEIMEYIGGSIARTEKEEQISRAYSQRRTPLSLSIG
jgi:hypothetical protein